MVKYEDVAHVTTEEYFNGNRFSIDAFNKKYALFEGETYPQALKRVCDYVASVEKTEELRKYWAERWFSEIYNDYWHPAGSIMQGAASGKKISLSNCTHISAGGNDPDREWDNLESIYKNTAYTVAKTAAYRQGLGVDFSRLRPRGASVLNSSNESTGAIHWMKEIDGIGYQVGQRGRIPAMLFSLNVAHPDVEEFITCKQDYTVIQNANISVQVTNSFYEAVKADKDWELSFEIEEINIGDRVYIDVHSIDMDCIRDGDGNYYKIAKYHRPYEKYSKTVKAKEILEMIAKGMYYYAEPGIQNIDIAKKFSNSDYLYDIRLPHDSRIIGTNACSEQYLSRESVCIISSINVGRFSIIPKWFKLQLARVGSSINRFLDNVNECELVYHTYATPHQRTAIEYLRRTGAGSTNWEGWMVKAGLEYGSDEANNAARLFNETYNYCMYNNSIELGKEKGNFLAFDRAKYEQSPFIQHMMELGLEFTHMRNVTISSIAPTGTLTLMFRDYLMSYGVEKAFGLYHWKRTRISGEYKYYFCVPRIVRDLFKSKGFKLPMNSDTIEDTWDGKYGSKIKDIIDTHKDEVIPNFKLNVEPKRKMNFMSELMKDCDSSISVTYMLPEDSKWEDVYDFILYGYEKNVKSIAAFPDRKMYGIVSYIPFKELAVKLIGEGKQIHAQNFSKSELEALNMNEASIPTMASDAPKRPKVLNADIFTVIANKNKYVVAVGLLNSKPYEIFCGSIGDLDFKFKEKEGKIEKIKRGHYKLIFNDGVVIDNFSFHFAEVERSLFRMVSTSLRHGVPIKFLVEQLQKSTDEMYSLTASAARVLKKYIEDGDKATGQICPSCGSNELIYEEGCITCSNCGWSKCS